LERVIKKPDIIYALIIASIGFLLFKTTFSMSLYGDEWKILWLGESTIKTKGNILIQQSTDLSYLFEIIVFNFISKGFGYNGTAYYVLSFLTRYIAALSIFWFLTKRGFSKIASFIGSLIFIVSPIGIEATDWARNFDSYLAIPLFLLVINYCIELKDKISVAFILIFLSLISLVNTTRAPGVFLVVVGVLFYLYLFNLSKKKLYFKTIISVILLFLFLSITPLFGNQAGGLFREFNAKVFLYSFFGSIGNALIPNINSLFVNYNFSVIVGLLFFVCLLLLSLSKRVIKVKNYYYLIVLILLSSFSFMIVPLIRIPQIHVNSYHRYLIHSAIVVPFITVLLIDLLKTKKIFYYLSLFSSVILIIYFIHVSDLFLTNQKTLHSNKYSERVWYSLSSLLDDYEVKGKRISLIIFTDRETVSKIDNSVAFGFNYHYGLINQLWGAKDLPPVWVIEGNFIDKSKIPQIVLDPEREIFVFEIKQEKVTDLTPMAKL